MMMRKKNKAGGWIQEEPSYLQFDICMLFGKVQSRQGMFCGSYISDQSQSSPEK